MGNAALHQRRRISKKEGLGWWCLSGVAKGERVEKYKAILWGLQNELSQGTHRRYLIECSEGLGFKCILLLFEGQGHPVDSFSPVLKKFV